MPTMEVWINDKSVAIGGDDDFDILTLGILGPSDSVGATVQMTGWKRRTSEHFQWLYVQLKSHDVVRVILRQHGATALPQSVWAYPKEDTGANNGVNSEASTASSKTIRQVPCTFHLRL